MAQKFVVIDAHSLIYRAYHALPPLSTSEGIPTNAAYGFAQMLLGLLENEKPDLLTVAFDPPGETFRHQEYAEYKANRPPMPDDLVPQIALVRDILEAFGIPVVEQPLYEADDVIATTACRAAAAGHDVVIVTGDRDPLQLVNERTQVLATLRGIKDTRRYDAEKVEAEYGVRPGQLADYKGLAGDTTDNIPGVPGIGPKTAARLLQQFDSVEEVLDNLDQVPEERLRKSLAEHAEQARLSKSLATLRTDAPVEADLEAALVERQHPEQARELFQRLEFSSLVPRLPASGVWEAEYRLVAEAEALEELCDELEAADGAAVACLSSGERETAASLRGIALAVAAGRGAFVPAACLAAAAEGGEGLFDQGDGAAQAPSAVRLRGLLADAAVEKWGHDLKRTAVVLRRHGVELEGLAFDSMVASYAVAPHRGAHSLDQLAAELLDASLPAAPGRKRRGEEPEQVRPGDLDRAQRRACAEADAVVRLRQALLDRVEQSPAAQLYHETEMPLVPVLAQMELAGIALDVERLRQLDGQMQTRVDELSAEIHELAGREFNVDSPKQLGQVLFEELKLPAGRRTQTGWSTSAQVLEGLAEEHEIVGKILEYRSFAKLKSTYVDGLLRLLEPKTNRVHTTFNQAVTATGRLSSSDPNLQNIPIRTEWGREIRACFVASRPDWQLISADYSQIELRLLAHLSEDENLLAAFRAGEDIHVRTAAEIFEVDPAEVNSEMRRRAKTVNFAVIYGMGARALAQDIDVSQQEAQDFIRSYFAKLPGVKRYIDRTLERAREEGAVSTIFGRRRAMPDLASTNPGRRSYAERAAVNHPIQGSAADVITMAMVALARQLAERQSAARLLLQVHDELVLEAPQEDLAATCELTREAMAAACQLSVPLTVDVAVGDNWRDMTPWER
ncbi:MAG: DNA polymerase I [Armatimonadota bacterium]